MESQWWALPWVSWPVGFLLGFASGFLANLAAEGFRRRKHKGEDYLALSCSGGVMQFEGKQQTSLSIDDIIRSVYGSGDTAASAPADGQATETGPTSD